MSNAFNTIKFKCRECEWIGTETQMEYADNGSDSEYCPDCGEIMFSNGNVYCDDIKSIRKLKIEKILE